MAKIKIKSPKEIEWIRGAGALAAETLIRAGELCKPGVSTLEIDEFIGEYTIQHEAALPVWVTTAILKTAVLA